MEVASAHLEGSKRETELRACHLICVDVFLLTVVGFREQSFLVPANI